MTPPRPRDEDGDREPRQEQDSADVACGPALDWRTEAAAEEELRDAARGSHPGRAKASRSCPDND